MRYNANFPPLTATLALLTTAFFSANVVADEADESTSYDGLVRIESSRADVAYIDPAADFSVFKRVAILEPLVSFRSNWQRDQNRTRRGSSRISSSDMERIKVDVAALFKEVFTERLQADDGFEVVENGGPDVLLVRPAIIDLDVVAPDVQTAGRSTTFSSDAGAATLFIELFDSMTGDILGRAADRRVARRAGTMATWSNRITNAAEARRVFGRWADHLRDFLEEHYTAADAEPSE